MVLTPDEFKQCEELWENFMNGDGPTLQALLKDK